MNEQQNVTVNAAQATSDATAPASTEEKKLPIFGLYNFDTKPYEYYAGDFKYISWADALAICKLAYPDMEYEFLDDPKTGMPYFTAGLFGEYEAGYYVKTRVTIYGVSQEMILSIMDYANEPIRVRQNINPNTGKKISQLDIRDIEDSQKRCLVKNIAAMTGLGLKIWSDKKKK